MVADAEWWENIAVLESEGSCDHIAQRLRAELEQVIGGLDVKGTPVMRMWNIVRLQSKRLLPVAAAFRYCIIEHGEAHLLVHDAPHAGACAVAGQGGEPGLKDAKVRR